MTPKYCFFTKGVGIHKDRLASFELTTSGKIFKTTNVVQSAEGDKDGLWTTTIATAVFII